MGLLDRLKRLVAIKKQRPSGSEQNAKPEGAQKDAALPCGGRTDISETAKQARVAQLTPREHALYLLLLEGYTLKESAGYLTIKYSTANTHMSSIYRKLGIRSRAQLIINYRAMTGSVLEH